jgi:hypothetical protein
MLAAAGAIQACGDSADGGAGGDNGAGAGGASGGARGDGGAVALEAGAGNSSAGSAVGGGGPDADAGAGGSAGAGASSADGGAGDDGVGGANACHISWTGAETGEAGCPSLHVCHQNFLSLNLDPDPPTPLKSIQLVYSPDHDLTVGTFMATGLDMVNCNVPTATAGVSYAPQLDQDGMLTGGTAMTVTLISLSFSTDANDPCSGSAHGSMDVVLPPTDGQAGAEPLALHAEF